MTQKSPIRPAREVQDELRARDFEAGRKTGLNDLFAGFGEESRSTLIDLISSLRGCTDGEVFAIAKYASSCAASEQFKREQEAEEREVVAFREQRKAARRARHR